jgi:phage terminase small subunit
MPRGGKRANAGRKPKKRDAEPPRERPAITLTVIEGGNGAQFPEPDWSLTYADLLDIGLAQRVWRDTITELRDSEKLAKVNIYTVERLVHANVLGQQALRHVAEEGAVFPRKGKKQPAWNPWFTVLKDANGIATTLEAELTITPRRRNNGGKVQKKQGTSRAADAFLKPVK